MGFTNAIFSETLIGTWSYISARAIPPTAQIAVACFRFDLSDLGFFLLPLS